MAQKRKNKGKKWLFMALLLVLFVAAGTGAFVLGKTFFKDSGGVLEPKTEDGQDVADEEFEEVEVDEMELADEADLAVPEEKVKQYEGENPNASGELTGVVTRAERDGTNLKILTNIDQTLNGGACELILSRGDEVISKYSARILLDVTTSRCDDFIVPVSELGSGDIDITINLSSGGKFGTIWGEAKI